MTTHEAELARAPHFLGLRLEQLRTRIESGDESAWSEYPTVAVALARLAVLAAPGARGEFLDTKTMAQRLGVSPKTLLRNRKKPGGVQPALVLGQRGRAALRWGSPA
jgi:hypothetical protein